MKTIKKLCLFLFVLQFNVLGFSQSRNLDSLQTELSQTRDNVKRFDLLNSILLDYTSYRGYNVDSLAIMEMHQIAQELNSDSLKAISYNWLGSYFYQMKGDNASALEYYFKALPFAEKLNDKRRISSIYFDMALVFFSMEDKLKALEVTRKGGRNLPNKEHPLYEFMVAQYEANMVEYFIAEKNVDSAFYYVKRSSAYTTNLNFGTSFNYTDFTHLGAVNALSGKVKIADSYFEKGLAMQDSIQNLSSQLYFFSYYLPFLFSENRAKEGLFHSGKLLKSGFENNNNNMKLAGASYLRQFYEAINQKDSAYYYSRMEAQINADMFSQDNKNRIESLLLNDQLRRIEEKNRAEMYQSKLKQYVLLTGLGMVLLIALILFRTMREKQKTNEKLETALHDLKSTQKQLIQAEKMASLGELTAGIAHEIQNPLNFVNNFSELSAELIDELDEEVEKGDLEEVRFISSDIKKNLEKITHHGKRADSIVKGMLAHSRVGKGEKELTNINELANEYLKLSYHGLRAKDTTFKAEFTTNFDPELPRVNVIPQDIGRVLLNLINNAFQACTERTGHFERSREAPLVQVSTKRTESGIQISVSDNGSGIPENIKDKIFQPFFTTKPTGQGTGLGLSLSYDIVKAHGGTISVDSSHAGTTFTILIPTT